MSVVLYTRQKVQAFVESIDSIVEMDFPYDHGRRALSIIEKSFKSLQTELDELDPEIASPATRALCKRAMELIEEHSFSLGFIVRSCDIRGPELQGPLLRLTRNALGGEAQLIMSSEWEYSPFTVIYPTDVWKTFVWVGMPSSEAANTLLAPMFGHELGHNIWQYLGLAATFEEKLLERATEELEGAHWDEIKVKYSLANKEDLHQQSLFGEGPFEVVHPIAMRQVEEIFCDMVGLCIFQAAYLHAFEYLLAPSFGQLRTPEYPDMKDRAEILYNAAVAAKIDVSDDYSARFDNAPVVATQDTLLQSIIDKISQERAQELLELALRICSAKNLNQNDRGMVVKIANAFRALVPCTNGGSISNIINGAWVAYLDPVAGSQLSKRPDKVRYRFIQELSLKSCEVFEIENLQEAQ